MDDPEAFLKYFYIDYKGHFPISHSFVITSQLSLYLKFIEVVCINVGKRVYYEVKMILENLCLGIFGHFLVQTDDKQLNF